MKNHIRIILNVIFRIKNWETYIKDYRGYIKNKKIVYKFRNGIKYLVRSGTNDRGIINEILFEKHYNPKGYDINKTDVIVDIGAQISIFSIYAAKQATEGKVYSFEPIRNNFNILKRNVELNSLKNVIILNKALSDTTKTETMFFNSTNQGATPWLKLMILQIKP